MRPAPIMAWLVAAALAAAAMAVSVPRYRNALSSAAVELARLEEVRALLTQSVAQRGTAGTDTTVPPSLTEAAASALAEAGLSASDLVGVSPGQETLLSGPVPITRQRATATLEGLTLPELGRFLDRWRSAQSPWTITGLGVSPLHRDTPKPGADLPLRVTLNAEARHAAAEDAP